MSFLCRENAILSGLVLIHPEHGHSELWQTAVLRENFVISGAVWLHPSEDHSGILRDYSPNSGRTGVLYSTLCTAAIFLPYHSIPSAVGKMKVKLHNLKVRRRWACLHRHTGTHISARLATKNGCRFNAATSLPVDRAMGKGVRSTSESCWYWLAIANCTS